MPAKPSSWAWKLAFRSRSANGERSSISRHQLTVSSSSLSSGTTVLTRPISSASSAEYILHRNHISFAFFGPTSLVRTEAPKPPSKLPTFGPTCPNFALSAAMVRSQTTCRTWPPPTAYPATIATTGLGQRRIWTCRSVTWKRPIDSPLGVRRGASGSSRYPASPRTFWSPPEQNASGPSPVRMMTPVSWSSWASSRALCISMTVSGRKAFLTSGRFMVIFAIPSAFSYLMSSNSPTDSHCMLAMQRIIWDLNTPDRGSSSQEFLSNNAVGSRITSCTLAVPCILRRTGASPRPGSSCATLTDTPSLSPTSRPSKPLPLSFPARLQAGLRRDTARVSDASAHREGEGPTGERESQRYRSLLRGWLLQPGQLQRPVRVSRRSVPLRVQALRPLDDLGSVYG